MAANGVAANGASPGDRTKVAVLGGGTGGITAAFELTATPELRERYEVTVYELGWRLGGKGASGRNAAVGQRIEEHGLHIWFGFYDNAFRLMRDAYEELGRSPDDPLSSFEEAFVGCDQLSSTTARERAGTPTPSRCPATSCAPAIRASCRPCGRSPPLPATGRWVAGVSCETSRMGSAKPPLRRSSPPSGSPTWRGSWRQI